MTGSMTGFLHAVTPGSKALRAVVLVAPGLALLATAVQGPGPRVLLLLVVLALSAAGAVQPESALLTAALGLVVCWWALAAREDVPITAIGAAWLLLAAHLAAVLLGYGPRELGIDPALARRWLARGLWLAAAPPTLWLLTVAVDGRGEVAGVWVAGLVAAIVVCVAAAVGVADREPGARG